MTAMEHPENEIDAFEPAYEAHKLRMAGYSWAEVARMTGYQSAPAASTAVKVYLSGAATELSNQRRKDALDLELNRLDDLQASWWKAATHGDDKAANVVLKIIGQRARLLGLEEATKDNQGGTRTILVMGSNNDYTKALKEIVNSEEKDDDQ